MKDLVALVADRNMEYALKGLLARPEALGMGAIRADIRVHPQHDPGCARLGVAFLANLSGRYRHGLLLFDHEGSGREQDRPREIQKSLDEDFARSAWGERAKAIILSPELEAWVWSDSPHVEEIAGWKGRQPPLRRWLADGGWLGENEFKPSRPKEAFQAALREVGRPRSSSLYQQIATKVSLHRCTDQSFLRLKDVLRSWFPRDRPAPNA